MAHDLNFLPSLKMQCRCIRVQEKCFCDACRSVKVNKIIWGSMVGEELIAEKVQAVYQEMVTWKKNLFQVPRGKSGGDFIKQLTWLILPFADATKWERL